MDGVVVLNDVYTSPKGAMSKIICKHHVSSISAVRRLEIAGRLPEESREKTYTPLVSSLHMDKSAETLI